MFSGEMFLPQPNSDTETALRNTYKLYALGNLIESFAKPFIARHIDGRSKERREMDRISLINGSLSAGIDPNVTLKNAGLSEEIRNFEPRDASIGYELLRGSAKKRELLPASKTLVKATAKGLGTLIGSETGTLMDIPGFTKFARKISKL